MRRSGASAPGRRRWSQWRICASGAGRGGVERRPGPDQFVGPHVGIPHSHNRAWLNFRNEAGQAPMVPPTGYPDLINGLYRACGDSRSEARQLSFNLRLNEAEIAPVGGGYYSGRGLGTFKDSLRAPVYRWFRYPAIEG
jgi:hypothetical protein